MKRPDRLPRTPLINPVATALWEQSGNWQVVYSGGLADHRAVEGAQGVYTVKVIPPLKVTDNGIGIDQSAPEWGVIIHRHCFTDAVDISGAAVADPGGNDITPDDPTNWIRGWMYVDADGLQNPAIPWPLCLNDDIGGSANTPTYGAGAVDVTPNGDCRYVCGTHYIDDDTGEWNVLVPLPPDANTDVYIGEVTDGTHSVAPCDKITFVAGTGATVVVADAGNHDATVTISVGGNAADTGYNDQTLAEVYEFPAAVKGWTDMEPNGPRNWLDARFLEWHITGAYTTLANLENAGVSTGGNGRWSGDTYNTDITLLNSTHLMIRVDGATGKLQYWKDTTDKYYVALWMRVSRAMAGVTKTLV